MPTKTCLRRVGGVVGIEAHLAAWERDTGNARVHGTTGEVPMARFVREEASRLKLIADCPPFRTSRMLERRARTECAVEVGGNAYSVPWRLIGERVEVVVASGQVRGISGAFLLSSSAVWKRAVCRVASTA
jgi:hypothetical protein